MFNYCNNFLLLPYVLFWLPVCKLPVYTWKIQNIKRTLVSIPFFDYKLRDSWISNSSYKIVNDNFFLCLTVFKILGIKLWKKRDEKKNRIKDRFKEWGMRNVKIVIIIIYFKFHYNYWELLGFFKLIKKCLCEFKVQFNPRMSRFLKQFLSKYFIFRII